MAGPARNVPVPDSEGWTRKPPPRSSLDDRYFYIRPGRSTKGTEGVDFVRGEYVVLEFYVNLLRSRARTKAAPATAAPVTNTHNSAALIAELGDAQLASAAEVVRQTYAADIERAEARARASRADLPTVGAQDQVAATQVTETQAATPEVAENQVIVMSQWAGKTVAGAKFQPADDFSASLITSGVPDHDEDDDQVEAQVITRSNELLADNNRDHLNVAVDGESEFGAIESGDEAEKDNDETGEYVSEDDADGECLPEDVNDDPDETEAEVDAEVLFTENVLNKFGGVDAVLAGNLKNEVLRNMSASGWDDVEDDVEEADVDEYIQQPYEPVDNSSSYPRLRQRYSGPSAEALRYGDSPTGLFFYMMPVVLWQHIATSSNEYHREMLPLRYEEAYRRYRKKYFASKRSRGQPELPRKTRRDIQNEMAAMKPIMPHELCRFVGLLVARTIAPNREKLANHWKTADVGAISRGCFDSVLSRDRFLEISRNLHFNSNKNPRAQTDRAWKIRKVVEVLQRTFARGYVAPSELSFDEAVLPSRSSFNKMRVYMKDKPHKWGTELFMLCSAVTAYCIRYVVLAMSFIYAVYTYRSLFV
ncbi:hypothetical protein PHMEG_00018463 [Phytophthora megakarya]|uniref:PiggyBac transposable element-derived protein domain-containing protein n=1 Tax=Phytophthora megakarya TaxID=4795 RepID=A0A225VVJ4_9STRA|nr:hypothetical protein PHMEG_00018463 [Phytophthora megakarya]